MRVNLTGNYVYGPLSLYATGCAHGGFKKLTADTLEASEPIESTEVGFDVQVQGAYTAVILSSDQAYSVINGNVKFDSSLFEYVVAIFSNRSVMVNDNKVFTPEGDTLPIEVVYNGDEAGKVVTLYFKNKTNTYDYSKFAFENSKVTVMGGVEVETTTPTISIKDDLTGDMKVDVVDIARGIKEGKTIATLKKSLVGVADESVSPLVGKSLLFLGDSIAKGAGDQYWMSWAARIGREGVLYDNVGQSGWTLTNTETSGKGQIATQLDKASRDEYDFVLLEGGVNDVRIYFGQETRWGEIETDLNVTEYDTSTIAGAMQDLIVKTQNKFGTAKVLWVINSYFSISSQEMSYSDHMERYIPLVKAICDLHGIEYIDLNDTETYPELVAVSNQNPDLYKDYLPDKLHPNAASYELTTPYVVEKMEEMLLQDK